jgi:methyl-accepting chemotaxis protein
MSSHDSDSLDSPVTRREFNAGMDRVLEQVRATGVVVEQMQSGQRAILASLQNLKEGVQRDMIDLEARLAVRIENLESVVREHSAQIRENSEQVRKLSVAVQQNSEDIRKNSDDIRKNSAEIRALTDAVAKLRHDFEHRTERNRLESLEERVEALEVRAGIRSPR